MRINALYQDSNGHTQAILLVSGKQPLTVSGHGSSAFGLDWRTVTGQDAPIHHRSNHQPGHAVHGRAAIRRPTRPVNHLGQAETPLFHKAGPLGYLVGLGSTVLSILQPAPMTFRVEGEAFGLALPLGITLGIQRTRPTGGPAKDIPAPIAIFPCIRKGAPCGQSQPWAGCQVTRSVPKPLLLDLVCARLVIWPAIECPSR